jgi:hypothetical protein
VAGREPALEPQQLVLLALEAALDGLEGVALGAARAVGRRPRRHQLGGGAVDARAGLGELGGRGCGRDGGPQGQRGEQGDREARLRPGADGAGRDR